MTGRINSFTRRWDYRYFSNITNGTRIRKTRGDALVVGIADRVNFDLIGVAWTRPTFA